jgi:hypothetical protein
MRRHRLGIAPMTPAERQAAPARPHNPDIAIAAHPAKAQTVGGGSGAHQSRRIKTAEKLQAITEFDLEELQTIDPPRGYNRD